MKNMRKKTSPNITIKIDHSLDKDVQNQHYLKTNVPSHRPVSFTYKTEMCQDMRIDKHLVCINNKYISTCQPQKIKNIYL